MGDSHENLPVENSANPNPAGCVQLVWASSNGHQGKSALYSPNLKVFDDGRIVEIGTYSELVQRDGIFAELVRSAEGQAPALLPPPAVLDPVAVAQPQSILWTA
jgi:hypothetical protein